jgi:hypothetical protein
MWEFVYGKVRKCKHSTVPIQNGLKEDTSTPKLFNFALEYTASNVRENHKKLTETHKLLVRVDVNFLGQKTTSVR